MKKSIREQLVAIDNGRDATMELLATTVKPLARVAYLLLRTAGTDVGRIRKRKEYRLGGFLIKRPKGRWNSEIEVYYGGKLVFHFNDNLSWITIVDRADNKKYLFYYRGGDWQQAMVDEYRKLATANLSQNFDIDGDRCDYFNHDTGVCGKHEDPSCPCEEYKEEGL